jgi:hypothetical protein
MREDLPEMIRRFRSNAEQSRIPEEALDLWATIKDKVSESQRLRLLVAWSKSLSTGEPTALHQACDEVIAEIPTASYDAPHEAMYHLLKKRHVAPQFGERTRVAPEERDYLVIDEVPDVFHAGHVHKLGTGRYHNVTVVNSGCWQAQTTFQKRVNIDPDAGFAPILDLDTLDLTIRKFT